MDDPDVIVVGGGPAGASVAFALARDGVGVHVIDRARFPRPKPCAEYTCPGVARVLANMGVLERVEQSGAAALTGIRIRAPNGAVIAGDFADAQGTRGFRDHGLSVRREVLDTILLYAARSAGARVTEGTRVTGLVRDSAGRVAGVTTSAEGAERRIRARLVVGADGLHSVISRRLGLAHTSRWPRRLALVTHYTNVAGMSEHCEMHVEHDGYAGIADVGHGLTTVALVVPDRHAREISANRTTFLEEWIAARPHLAPRFAGAVRATPVVATGPFASRARRVWAPGAALVGDAAEFFDPFTGEGIYAAMRGGELLADAVRDALAGHTPGDADEALVEYDAARRREFGDKRLVQRVIAAVVGTRPLINRAAPRLAARKDLADLLAGVTGNFIPAGDVIKLRYIWNVFGAPVQG